MSAADDHGIFVNLRGTVCACGESKLAGKSFCRRNYFQLPRALRDALYQPENYAETYRRALTFLELPEPKALPRPTRIQPPPLADEARSGRNQDFAPRQYRRRDSEE